MVSGKLYDITFGEYKPCNKRIMEASDVSGWMKNYQHQQTWMHFKWYSKEQYNANLIFQTEPCNKKCIT